MVLAELRKLLAQDRRKLFELRPAAKPISRRRAFGVLPVVPWIAGAAESLRAAGLPQTETVNTVEAGYPGSASLWEGGQWAWNRADAERSDRAVAHDFETLRLTDTRLAALFTEAMSGCCAPSGQRARLKVLAQRSG
jgi:hypothetical protein